MYNFCQFWNAINGEPYHDVPPPVRYDMKPLVTGQINGTEEGSTYELRPLSHEDTASYAADDVVAHYSTMHNGKNPRRLGEPLSDAEFKKFLGHTW